MAKDNESYDEEDLSMMRFAYYGIVDDYMKKALKEFDKEERKKNPHARPPKKTS